MKKLVYAFQEGHKEMKMLLGGKGANLAEMMKIGLPVPDGFTLTTEACFDYYAQKQHLSDLLESQIKDAVKVLEDKTGKQLGNKSNPLLVSVRSGAVVSMPGMMDTVLNLGLNDETAEGLATLSDPVFAYDAYRRFIQMFSDVVLGIEKYKFDQVVNRQKSKTVAELKADIQKYKLLVFKEKKIDFPENVYEQLTMAIKAVFDSWHNHRALIYRRLNNIPDDLGTAVNIQSMVFGNLSNNSGTGVAFTRNPSTGEFDIYGEYLLNAQGEDVVAGIRTPEEISSLKEKMPEVYKEFIDVANLLEAHYKDMQDIEFTIEAGKLYLLQTRTGKRTAQAALKIAVDLVNEKVIDVETALMRVDPEQIHQLLHPTFSEETLSKTSVLSKGLPASPGAASGKIYFDSESVKEAVLRGEETILVRTETSPEDIEGMIHANGIVTSRGGMTSHAAVVARGMGKCCIAGCPDVHVDLYNKRVLVGGLTLNEGDHISLDGSTGHIFDGYIDAGVVNLSEEFKQIMTWSDEKRRLGIRCNADNHLDAKVALDFGAEGIGLCRTEHMFFEKDRINDVRRLILSEEAGDRAVALSKLLPHQRSDFLALFRIMAGKAVTVRLLDPPLHEFLPHGDDEIALLAEEIDRSVEDIKTTILTIQETNPMLGHRGCRLGITYPEIYDMQVQAIFEAVVLLAEEGIEVTPEIMIPLVGYDKELALLRKNVERQAQTILTEAGVACSYKIGTMIEVPRAALTADEIAKSADFFSFGTNDLTQMTLGFSRDDSAKFIHVYKDQKIFEVDPFESIDQNGVGKLMELAKKLGTSTRKDIKMGICGEHGGEPKSIAFCHKIGLDYVSCSPFRVPVARLAAAQAAIKETF